MVIFFIFIFFFVPPKVFVSTSRVRYDPKITDVVRQQQLSDWGFNAVRLGAMWTGVEPEEGQVQDARS